MIMRALCWTALTLLFGRTAVHAVEYGRYNYRDHPDYIHVAQGDKARLMPAPPPIDCATEFNDNDAAVVAYLVGTNEMHACPFATFGYSALQWVYPRLLHVLCVCMGVAEVVVRADGSPLPGISA
jgi:hypothetical protein